MTFFAADVDGWGIFLSPKQISAARASSNQFLFARSRSTPPADGDESPVFPVNGHPSNTVLRDPATGEHRRDLLIERIVVCDCFTIFWDGVDLAGRRKTRPFARCRIRKPSAENVRHSVTQPPLEVYHFIILFDSGTHRLRAFAIGNKANLCRGR